MSFNWLVPINLISNTNYRLPSVKTANAQKRVSRQLVCIL